MACTGDVGTQRIDSSYAAVVRDAAPRRRPAARDPALLIYTSGTTGLPKAAIVTHGRLVEWSCWFAAMMDVTPADRLYDCLPMYHSTGGVVAIGAMLVKGGSVMIARRFSASRFWDDVVDGGCTIVQYIGELCRYLAQSPTHPRELQHCLRWPAAMGCVPISGSGFSSALPFPHLLEFYAATEGSVSLYNCEEKPGAVGRVPQFLAHRFPSHLSVAMLKLEKRIRGADGLCMRCGPDETGEAIGQIVGPEPKRAAFRRLHGRRSHRKQSAARCLCAWGSLVPHRRPDAQRPCRLLLFRRSNGGHVPLERRECIDDGSVGGGGCVSGCDRSGRLWCCGTGTRDAPAWPPSRSKQISILLCCTVISSQACLTMRAPFPARVRTPRGDGHV